MRRFSIYLLLAQAVCYAQSERRDPTSVTELFVSEENLTVIKRPQRVSACLLKYIAPAKGGSRTEERYEEGPSIDIPADLADEISRVLLSDDCYQWDTVKGCWPRYVARIHFRREGRSVTVDLCFRCQTLLISRDGKAIAGEDFDRYTNFFRSVFSRLFAEEAITAGIAFPPPAPLRFSQLELTLSKKAPNKAPEPTPGPVTPRAPSGDSK